MRSKFIRILELLDRGATVEVPKNKPFFLSGQVLEMGEDEATGLPVVCFQAKRITKGVEEDILIQADGFVA